MNIMKKIQAKAADNWGAGAVTIAFLGDSVTQGCFELYKKEDGGVETYFDKESTYHGYLNRMLSLLYPSVPVNIINAGISGSNVQHALERLERDVLRFSPDLTVVCFGLNDSGAGAEGIASYIDGLAEIFDRLQAAGSEIIFMTPNMMNTHVSVDLKDQSMRDIAENTMKTQNEGVLQAYLDAAVNLCGEKDVKVCDCYAKWKRLYENGVDTTQLLANRINHPSREMNWLFAVSLLDTMLTGI